MGKQCTNKKDIRDAYILSESSVASTRSLHTNLISNMKHFNVIILLHLFICFQNTFTCLIRPGRLLIGITKGISRTTSLGDNIDNAAKMGQGISKSSSIGENLEDAARTGQQGISRSTSIGENIDDATRVGQQSTGQVARRVNDVIEEIPLQQHQRVIMVDREGLARVLHQQQQGKLNQIIQRITITTDTLIASIGQRVGRVVENAVDGANNVRITIREFARNHKKLVKALGIGTGVAGGSATAGGVVGAIIKSMVTDDDEEEEVEEEEKKDANQKKLNNKTKSLEKEKEEEIRIQKQTEEAMKKYEKEWLEKTQDPFPPKES